MGIRHIFHGGVVLGEVLLAVGLWVGTVKNLFVLVILYSNCFFLLLLGGLLSFLLPPPLLPFFFLGYLFFLRLARTLLLLIIVLNQLLLGEWFSRESRLDPEENVLELR